MYDRDIRKSLEKQPRDSSFDVLVNYFKDRWRTTDATNHSVAILNLLHENKRLKKNSNVSESKLDVVIPPSKRFA